MQNKEIMPLVTDEQVSESVRENPTEHIRRIGNPIYDVRVNRKVQHSADFAVLEKWKKKEAGWLEKQLDIYLSSSKYINHRHKDILRAHIAELRGGSPERGKTK